MSGTHDAPYTGAPGELRPLPPTLNLEFERKRAKKLLRHARAGDAHALALVRQRWPRGGTPPEPAALKLADVQFVVARDYGFSGWPRLVEYFEAWRRQVASRDPRGQVLRSLDDRVESFLRGLRAGQRWQAAFVSTFVPRFYGWSNEDIPVAEVTHDEARLVVARQHHWPNWEAMRAATAELLAKGEQGRFVRASEKPLGLRQKEELKALPHGDDPTWRTPHGGALIALFTDDVDEFVRLVEAHPGLLEPDRRGSAQDSLLHSAWARETFDRSESAARIVEWIVSRLENAGEALGPLLCSAFRAKPERIARLLDVGADPAWVAPNGLSVLDHALLRYWNPEAVDLVARRVVPRKAFWIAAGLGDVPTMLSFLDARVNPTDAARRDRPDFNAVGPWMNPASPGASDVEIVWEAWVVAALNRRCSALDALLARGYPIDYAPWGSNMLHFAVGNRMADLVEYFVSHGADVNVKGFQPTMSAREAAAFNYAEQPDDPAVRRIHAACGRGR